MIYSLTENILNFDLIGSAVKHLVLFHSLTFLRVISKESFIIVSVLNLLLEFLRTCSVVKFYSCSSSLWEHFHHRGSLRSLFVMQITSFSFSLCFFF